MNFFIFQSVPERYDMRTELQAQRDVTWNATRYRQQMGPGDCVFFWMAGDEDIRGLYGWGVLTSTPYAKASWDGYGVDATFKVKFAKPVLARTIKQGRNLKDLLIFRAPQASNFLLAPKEASALAK